MIAHETRIAQLLGENAILDQARGWVKKNSASEQVGIGLRLPILERAGLVINRLANQQTVSGGLCRQPTVKRRSRMSFWHWPIRDDAPITCGYVEPMTGIEPA